MEPTRPDRLTLTAFAVLVVIAGANGVAIRFSNRGLPPFWGAGLRFALASLAFFAVVLVRRVPLPRGRALVGTATFGAVIGLGFGLGYWALQRIQAGTSQVIMALVPLLTLFLALAHRQERFRWRGLAGGLLAIGGVAIMFGPRAGGPLPVGALVATLGTAVCLAEGTVLAKSLPTVPPAAMNAVAMAVSALILTVTSLIAGERIGLPSVGEAWLALGYLVLFGSLAVFALFLFVIRRWTASGTAYEFVLFPVVAVALSAWLDREPLTPALFLAGALVIAGVYVGALMKPRVSGAPPEALPVVAASPADLTD
ncbi:MAG: DMT family transporter [Actinomycetota bacterium]